LAWQALQRPSLDCPSPCPLLLWMIPHGGVLMENSGALARRTWLGQNVTVPWPCQPPETPLERCSPQRTSQNSPQPETWRRNFFAACASWRGALAQLAEVAYEEESRSSVASAALLSQSAVAYLAVLQSWRFCWSRNFSQNDVAPPNSEPVSPAPTV
jgi:hypothetical protein